jgi:hypothetical protein
MYAQRIDFARKAVAILFGVFGFAFLVCINLRHEVGSIVFGLFTLGSLIAALSLFAEYLVRSWFETRHNGSTRQFTIRELLIAITALGLLLACWRILGGATVLVFLAAFLLTACGIEEIRNRSRR